MLSPRQRNPARLFDVVGINGMTLPTPQNPAAPTILPEDRTSEYLARADQSVQQGFDISMQNIESSNAARQAEARSQSQFPGTFSNVASAIQAGLQGYANVLQVQSEIEQQQLLAEEEAAAEQEAQLQADLASRYENEIRTGVARLQDAFSRNVYDEGYIPTFQAWLRERRRLFEQQGLNPEVLQTITNIGWDTLSTVQRERGAKVYIQQEELRSGLQEDASVRLSLALSGEIAAIRANPRAFQDDETLMSTINNRIDSYLRENNLSGIDAILVRSSVLQELQGALQESGLNNATFNNQNTVLAEVLNKAAAAYEQFSGNPTQLNLAMTQLQLELSQAGIDIDLRSKFRTNQEILLEELDIQQKISALTSRSGSGTDATGMPQFRSSQDREAYDTIVQARALSWITGPVDNAMQIELASSADAPLDMKASYRIYQEFTDDQERYRTLRNELYAADTNSAQLQADLELLKDEIAPTQRLGNVRRPDVLAQQLITIFGQERPQLSDEAFAALERVRQFDQAAINEESRLIMAELNELGQTWARLGFDLDNPYNTSLMDARYEAAINYTNEQITSGQLVPDSAGGMPMSPSNFQQGLPPLPRR